ncbi:MAG: biopolymer transporter ExbD [Gemmataceae bacterium]|nr:biopolymer transporter ExbD [Gemmataceae bacterium]
MSRRRMGHTEEGGVNLAVIITPFLDMAFQLLAFFIMTYNPSALEGHINGALVPPSKVATVNKNDKNVKEDPDPLTSVDDIDLTETTIVTVKSVLAGQPEGDRVDGEPSRILLKRVEDTAATRVVDGNVSLKEELKGLERKLKEGAKGAVKANIRIEGDGELKHQFVMQVYDVCKGAGYQNVSFVAPAAKPRNP